MTEQKYKYKSCVCGDLIPYSMNSLCFTCIENGTKISGYIGRGKISINDNLK